MPRFGAYAAAKAAVVALTNVMAREWAPKVRANSLLVGHVDTPRTTATRSASQLEWLKQHIAMGRLGHPEEIAEVVSFVASDAASWLTGAALEIDGGGRCL
jgi:NAD(P)-dependent dehydrogenase (short-subunit alcohol dehydrogenase family)